VTAVTNATIFDAMFSATAAGRTGSGLAYLPIWRGVSPSAEGLVCVRSGCAAVSEMPHEAVGRDSFWQVAVVRA
jgi:hypothetical protein